MIDPFRTAAEMPEEKPGMTDNEMVVRNFKIVLTAACIAGSVGFATNMGSNLYHDYSANELARINATKEAREGAEARAVEAKSLAEKAMWEAQKK